MDFDFSSPLFLESSLVLPFTYELLIDEPEENFFECFIKKTEEKVPEEYSPYLLHYVIHIKEADLKYFADLREVHVNMTRKLPVP